MGKFCMPLSMALSMIFALSTSALSSEGKNHNPPSSKVLPTGLKSPEKSPKIQKAHEHGHVLLQIAVQNLDLAVHLEAPAEAFFGFEHRPQSEKEKELVHDVEKKLKTDLSLILGVEPGLDCQFHQLDIKHGLEEYPQLSTSSSNGPTGAQKNHQGDHADFELDAKGKCTKSPVGSSLKISLIKEFKGIKKIKLEVISGEKVKSETVTKSIAEVQL